MANLRMFAIAAALSLAIPFVGAAGGGTEILDLWGEAEAIITDIEILRPPTTKTYDPDQFYAEEQLVEGHIVFATINFRANVTPAEEGNLTIDGVVHCDHHVEITTWMGVVPTGIKRAGAACYVGERVIVTPEPWNQTQPLGSSSPPQFQPNGNIIPFTTPSGERSYMEELTFTADDGRTLYAWAVPVLKPWTNEAGRVKNFYAPLPEAGLRENGTEHYRVLFENP